MSGSKDDFWKELMGEDFKVDEPVYPPSGAPAGQDPAPDRGSGFTIEYVSRDGTPVEPAAEKAPDPSRIGPQDPARSGTTKPPAQSQAQKPAAKKPQGQSPAPAQPRAQKPASEGKPKPAAPSGGADLFDEMSRGLGNPQAPRLSEAKGVPPAAGRPAPASREPAFIHDGSDEAEEPEIPSAPESPGRRKRRRSKEDRFEVEFDFDAAYPDVNEKAVRRGRTRRTGCLSGILLFLFIICVSVILASVGWMWATDVLGFDGKDETVEVTLARDIFHTEERQEEDDEGNTVTVEKTVADMDAVAEELYSKGVVKYKWLFKMFAKLSNADTKVQAGTWTLNMNYDYRAIVHGMTARSGKRDTITLTIPEGYTITQIVAMMDENGVCGRDELLDSLANTDFDYDFLKADDVPPLGEPKRLEGYLFPDTYEFYINDDPDDVIRRFLANFQRKWTDEIEVMAQELGYTRQQVLTVASMVEKEAGTDSERDTISSVIYNRLEHPDAQGTNGLLQIDATINYIIADTGQEYSVEIDSPYNTYLYPGLPAGPIANPGMASIRAALKPAETDYYYYALGLNKSHSFFTNYSDFVSFVNSDQYGG